MESLRNIVSAPRVVDSFVQAWPIKGGSMGSRPALMSESVEATGKRIEAVYASVHELDGVLEHYAYALEIIQPTDSPGKIAVRFLRRRAGWKGPAMHPQIVQWYRSRNNRWLYHRLEPNEVLRKVPSYTVFQPVREDIKTLLREVIRLMKHREANLATLHNFSRQAASLAAGNTVFNADKKDQILDWLPLLKEKRERLIAESRQAVALADAALPTDVVPSSASAPRVSRTGSVRGRLNQSGRRSL